MGTFSIWHWLIVLLIFAVPVVAIEREKSDRKITRKPYLIWVAGLFAYGIAMNLIKELLPPDAPIVGFFGLAFFIGLLVVLYFYNQAVVRRLRDAGHSKGLAYAGVLPFINLGLMVYLAIKPSSKGSAQA